MSERRTAPAAVGVDFDPAVVERAAEPADVGTDSLVDALVVLHAELIGRHSNLEADTDYVTVDGRRAYRVRESVWDEFLAEFDFDDPTEAAVRYVPTEQAKLLFAKSVRGPRKLRPRGSGSRHRYRHRRTVLNCAGDACGRPRGGRRASDPPV